MKSAMSRRNQLTVRGLDPQVEAAIRALARRERISLSQAANKLLAKGVGMSEPAAARSKPSYHLLGDWTKEEMEEFNESIRWLDQADLEFQKREFSSTPTPAAPSKPGAETS